MNNLFDMTLKVEHSDIGFDMNLAVKKDNETISTPATAKVYIPSAAVEEVQNELLEYLNKVNTKYLQNTFNTKNEYNELYSIMLNEDLSYKEDIEAAKKQRQQTYDIITTKPYWKHWQHSYKASNCHTPRLHMSGIGWYQLGRSVRKELFEGFYQGDLKSSQMAIAATLLDIPDLISFFKNKSDLWAFLASETGLERKHIKANAKPILYGILFGMGTDKRIKRAKELNIEKILEVDLIKQIIAKRDAQYKTIKDNAVAGIYTDVLGQEHKITKEYAPHQILANVFQSIEFLILGKAITTEKLYKEVNLQCWLHDGFICKNKEYMENVKYFVEKTALNLLKNKPIYITLDIEEI